MHKAMRTSVCDFCTRSDRYVEIRLGTSHRLQIAVHSPFDIQTTNK